MTEQLDLAVDPPRAWHRLSGCTHYRYLLGHRWGPGPLATFCLTNPSTALATNDGDATSRKLDGFSRRWGFGGRVIVNVAAWRSRDPDALLDTPDPFGPDNELNLSQVFAEAYFDWIHPGGPIGEPPFVVFGWGQALPVGERFTAAARRAVHLAKAQGLRPMCLGLTRDGNPRHPLFVSYATALQPFEVRP